MSIDEVRDQDGAPSSPVPAGQMDDRELFDLLRRGEMDPLDLLHRRYLTGVYWAAFRILHDRMDAEDVAQDTFLTLWRRRREIEMATSLLPWLLTTARYLALNRLRERNRQQQRRASLEGEVATPDSVEESVILAEQMLAIERALAELPPLDQQIYRLCLEEGLLYKQAARQLRVSHATIRNRLSRIRAVLRKETGR